MSGMMTIGAFISMIGTFFSVVLMILATVNDVKINEEVGIWGLLKGYGAMDFFIISIAAIIIWGIGICAKYKKKNN